MDEIQKRTAQSVVNIFETGRASGDYGQVTLLQGDTGHLTYGRAQTTLASGNLHLLVKDYCETKRAGFADELRPYLPKLAARDVSLDGDMKLRGLLRAAGDDPVMRVVQDDFFDRVYWNPAATAAASLGIISPLGGCVVYDSFVHGSWSRMRDRTTEQHGAPSAIGPDPWISCYVAVRRDWLSRHSNRLLRKTVYRMECFRDLIDAAKWSLPLPLVIQGVAIEETEVEAQFRLRASAEVATVRNLLLRSPRLHGEDVRKVQRALIAAGVRVEVSGIYDARTAEAVREIQAMRGLKVDGIVGPATRALLGL